MFYHDRAARERAVGVVGIAPPRSRSIERGFSSHPGDDA
jgi:hypothetical protein